MPSHRRAAANSHSFRRGLSESDSEEDEVEEDEVEEETDEEDEDKEITDKVGRNNVNRKTNVDVASRAQWSSPDGKGSGIPSAVKSAIINHIEQYPAGLEAVTLEALRSAHPSFYKDISASGVKNKYITNLIYYIKQQRKRFVENPTTPSTDSTMADRGSSRRANFYQDFLPRGFPLERVGKCTAT